MLKGLTTDDLVIKILQPNPKFILKSNYYSQKIMNNLSSQNEDSLDNEELSDNSLDDNVVKDLV